MRLPPSTLNFQRFALLLLPLDQGSSGPSIWVVRSLRPQVRTPRELSPRNRAGPRSACASMVGPDEASSPERGGRFVTTHWSVVLAAKAGGGPQAAAALE